jgi:UDP-N-acetylglucosamine 4,6-dehydratase
MKGGEIFIPKLPSMRMTDLAKAMCPTCEIEIIGIRPGEKLSEVMVPRDEARNTTEFDNYYIIQPDFIAGAVDSRQNYGGEVGRPVDENFEYASDTNDVWMSEDDFGKLGI